MPVPGKGQTYTSDGGGGYGNYGWAALQPTKKNPTFQNYIAKNYPTNIGDRTVNNQNAKPVPAGYAERTVGPLRGSNDGNGKSATTSASATDFGSGGGGTSTPGLYDDILKRLADAYNQRKLAQDAAYQQALKDQEYQDLLGRERNNSWLNTANRQVRNVMGNENSGLAKYSQARNQTNWLSKQADTQMAGNQVRANLNAQNMAKKADIEDAYAQTLYNLYNNQLSWEHYLKG